ncbi:hypothetical protein PF006_g33204 [Phytophthora fragariae]|nr:hypothetical protein PF006_g33204 [Phytophthora fragariae]
MDLSHAEDEEAELREAEARRGIRRCFTCGSTDHLRSGGPQRKQRPAQSSGNTASNRPSGSSRGNGDSQ